MAHDAGAVLLAGGLICAVGVIDDMVELNALAKIAGQLLAAGVVVLNGVKVYWIPLPDAIVSLDEGSSIAVTLVFIFVAVNAINLIDGLDGLAAGVVAIGAGAFFTYAYLLSYEQELVRATTSSLVTVATVGICLGFLPYNIHRARMFMGDSGAMLLGFLLATSVISLSGQLDPASLENLGFGAVAAYLPLLLPFAVLASAAARPGAGLRPADAARQAVVPGRQAAPAPPDAEPGPLPPGRGRPAVAVVGAGGLRGRADRPLPAPADRRRLPASVVA